MRNRIGKRNCSFPLASLYYLAPSHICDFPYRDGPNHQSPVLGPFGRGQWSFFAIASAKGVIVFDNRFLLPNFLLNTVIWGFQRSISLLELAVITSEVQKVVLNMILAIQAIYRTVVCFSKRSLTFFPVLDQHFIYVFGRFWLVFLLLIGLQIWRLWINW